MNNIKLKAILVCLFSSIFSGGLLFLLLKSISLEETPFLKEMAWLFPMVVGASIGLYSAKFSVWVSERQEKA